MVFLKIAITGAVFTFFAATHTRSCTELTHYTQMGWSLSSRYQHSQTKKLLLLVAINSLTSSYYYSCGKATHKPTCITQKLVTKSNCWAKVEGRLLCALSMTKNSVFGVPLLLAMFIMCSDISTPTPCYIKKGSEHLKRRKTLSETLI